MSKKTGRKKTGTQDISQKQSDGTVGLAYLVGITPPGVITGWKRTNQLTFIAAPGRRVSATRS